MLLVGVRRGRDPLDSIEARVLRHGFESRRRGAGRQGRSADVRRGEPVTHKAKGIGTTEQHVVRIELKYLARIWAQVSASMRTLAAWPPTPYDEGLRKVKIGRGP
jgi:hypothetical protein